MTAESTVNTIPCRECQAGQLHRKFVTYFTWLGDELITVQDFPAWICDVCGRREYDPQAVNQLSPLLSPNTGKPPKRRRTMHRRVSKQTRPREVKN